jgi:hypothetical protein
LLCFSALVQGFDGDSDLFDDPVPDFEHGDRGAGGSHIPVIQADVERRLELDVVLGDRQQRSWPDAIEGFR